MLRALEEAARLLQRGVGGKGWGTTARATARFPLTRTILFKKTTSKAVVRVLVNEPSDQT